MDLVTKKYETMEFEIFEFQNDDVITDSCSTYDSDFFGCEENNEGQTT